MTSITNNWFHCDQCLTIELWSRALQLQCRQKHIFCVYSHFISFSFDFYSSLVPALSLSVGLRDRAGFHQLFSQSSHQGKHFNSYRINNNTIHQNKISWLMQQSSLGSMALNTTCHLLKDIILISSAESFSSRCSTDINCWQRHIMPTEPFSTQPPMLLIAYSQQQD